MLFGQSDYQSIGEILDLSRQIVWLWNLAMEWDI